MISGTQFLIEVDARSLGHALRPYVPKLLSAFELGELLAECEENRAMCLACDDGVVAVELRAHDDHLEMFVRAAVAYRHGAFARQGAAVLAIARDLGASTVAFEARRRGWARRLGPEWVRRGSREFVREV
jgi:hypothetical protein